MRVKKSNPFRLRDFLDVDTDQIARLENIGIKYSGQILVAGKSAQQREALAERAGIAVDEVLKLVRLSDLARLPGVKGIRARLYYEAGVDCVEKLASFEPQALLELTADFVRLTGFEGIAPLPKEVSSTIANARKLTKIVEW